MTDAAPTQTQTLTFLAAMPWTFHETRCCTPYKAEIWQDERRDTFITCTHSASCKIWRYIP